MIHEIQKILTSRYLLLLLIGAALLNGILFYRHCTDDSDGYTLKQVQQIYDLPLEELQARQDEMIARSFADMEAYTDSIAAGETYDDNTENGLVFDDSLITGDIYREGALYGQAIRRKEEIREFPSLMRQLQQEAEVKKIFFATDDLFTLRVLDSTVATYHAFEDVTVTDEFSAATELVGDWTLSDLLLLLFGCTAGLFLLTQEQAAGLMCLLRPTKYGKGRLWRKKFAAMCALVALGFLMIYGANFVIAGALFGFGDLNRAVQSVYGFSACPYRLTAGGYLTLISAWKLVWAITASSVFFLLCSLTAKAAVAIGGGAAAVGAALWMETSNSLWVRACSLSHARDVTAQLRGCIYLKLFDAAIPALWASLAVMLLLTVAAAILSALCFCRRQAIAGTGRLRLAFPPLCTVNGAAHEGWKLFLLHGGLAVLAVLAAVQYSEYRDFYVMHSAEEQYYRRYSQQLTGEPTEEKAVFLEREAARFDEIRAESAIVQSDEKRNELENQLRAEQPFLKAAAQYRRLTDAQEYVYETGYERLYNGEGRADDLKNTLLLTLALLLTLSGVFAVETESGVRILQKSAGKERRIARDKLIWTAVFALMAMTIVYLPQYLCVLDGYGLPQLATQANSVDIFVSLPNAFSLRGVLLLTAAIRLLLTGAASGLILFFSRKTGNTVVTMLLSLGVLVIPLIVAIVLQ